VYYGEKKAASFFTITSNRLCRKPPRQKSASKGIEHQEFRKAIDAVGLRVRNGQVRLLSHKLFNIMIYEVQQQWWLPRAVSPSQRKDKLRNSVLRSLFCKKTPWPL
jgi:hypothetical protein